MPEKFNQDDERKLNENADLFDQFIENRNLEDEETWINDHNKKKCPSWFSLHKEDATQCTVCDWEEPK
jgi:hypothetical protein